MALEKSIILIDGTASGFTEDSLSANTTLYFVRTTDDGSDGYLRINGKDYGKCESDNKFLKRSGQTLTQQEINQVYENIGWTDQVTNIYVSGLPSGETCTVTVKCDGETTTLTGGTQYQTMIYMYCDYTIEGENKVGYMPQEPIKGFGMRGATKNHTITYTPRVY